MSRSSGFDNLNFDLDSPSTPSGGESTRGRRRSKDGSRSRDGSRGKSRNKGTMNRSSTESGSSQVNFILYFDKYLNVLKYKTTTNYCNFLLWKIIARNF